MRLLALALLAGLLVSGAVTFAQDVKGSREVFITCTEREALHGITLERQALIDGVLRRVYASPQWRALDNRTAAVVSETCARLGVRPKDVLRYDDEKGALVLADAAPVSSRVP